MLGAALRRRRGMVASGFLLALIVITAWFWVDRSASDTHPALWRISDGKRTAYLFGTIHAVPSGARWLTPSIEQALDSSNVLVLEASDLAAERASRATFERLGRNARLKPVAVRLDKEDRAAFAQLVRTDAAAFAALDGYEDWAAALLINAAASGQSGLSAEQAPEAMLSARATDAHKPVVGLETVGRQLGLFDRLSPTAQRRLLSQAIKEARQAGPLFDALYADWRRGELAGLERQFLAPLASEPELRQRLIDERNARWAFEIDHVLRHSTVRPFVAVGAGHLVGRGSVQARLEKLGWRVERIE